MQTPKKRKHDVVESRRPRITFRALGLGRTFDRLFKDETLEDMKDTVRRKLCVATSMQIKLSQVRGRELVDLEDDDDFEAFRDFASTSQDVQVNVVVGSVSNTHPLSNGDLVSSSGKKKKQKPGATEHSIIEESPEHKKRRVSFVEPIAGQAVQNNSSILATPGKRKHKNPDDSPVPSEPATGTKKKSKKRKIKSSDTVDELDLQTGNGANGIPPETPKKKRKGESIGQETSSRSSKSSSTNVDDEDPRPVKKLKTKSKEVVDDEESPPPLEEPRSKSVPPQSTITTSTASTVPLLAVPSVDQEVSSKSKKKSVVTAESEPSSSPAASELVAIDGKSKPTKSKLTSKAVEVPSVEVPIPSSAETSEQKKKDTDLSESRGTPSTSLPDKSVTEKANTVENPSEPHAVDNGKSAAKPTRARSKGVVGESSKPAKTAREKSGNSNEVQGPSSEEMKEATLAAIQAVLARNVITPSSQPTQNSEPQPPQTASSPAPASEENTPEPVSKCSLCDESPSHDRPDCPVIIGGMRALRKRLGQLQKGSSGDGEERQQVIAELEAMIQKRARKPKPKVTTENSNDVNVEVVKDAETHNGDPLPSSSIPIAEATKTAKQVDVVSSRTRLVVDVVLPASTRPTKPISTNSNSSKSEKQSSKPLQKYAAKTTEKKTTTEKLKKNPPLVGDSGRFGLGDQPSEDISRLDLQSIIHGPKLSVADIPSSSSEEEEEEKEEERIPEELIISEDEPISKKSEKPSTRLGDYPSSSDVEEDNSDEGSVAVRASPPPSTDGEKEKEDFLSLDVGDKWLGVASARGSSREVDGEDSAGVKDVPIGVVDGKSKPIEGDSDTVVGSQVEELVDRTKENNSNSTKAVTNEDPIESPEQSSDERPVTPPLPSTPKVESSIRTRSHGKRSADTLVKSTKVAKRLSELPIPFTQILRAPLARLPITRKSKSQDHQAKDSIDDRTPNVTVSIHKTPVKDTKRVVNTRSKTLQNERIKAKSSKVTPNSVTSKSRTSRKITLEGPENLADEINKASAMNASSDKLVGSQWAILPEDSQLMETSGQVDELVSDTGAAFESQDSQGRLFLPSSTQQSFPYSQFPEIFASQKRNKTPERTSHESTDENEVLESVVKSAKPARTYRGLSQFASSQTFVTPKFQSGTAGKGKEPESLYGRRRQGGDDDDDGVVPETDSNSSESEDEERSSSHIPVARRAGASVGLKK